MAIGAVANGWALKAAGYVAERARRRRFLRFMAATDRLPRPLRVLDVGGTVEFWEACGWAGRDDVSIVLLNVYPMETRYSNIECSMGDAADLSRFESGSFQIVFSNSVIEHLITPERQAKMASEIQRVGRSYWVQTPNYWFPVEPHFNTIGWQWLPESTRVKILLHRGVGWVPRCQTEAEALEKVRGTLLLKRSDLLRFFPTARLEAESLGGLVKSWIVIGGM